MRFKFGSLTSRETNGHVLLAKPPTIARGPSNGESGADTALAPRVILSSVMAAASTRLFPATVIKPLARKLSSGD